MPYAAAVQGAKDRKEKKITLKSEFQGPKPKAHVWSSGHRKEGLGGECSQGSKSWDYRAQNCSLKHTNSSRNTKAK